jgi:hypothetical protein
LFFLPFSIFFCFSCVLCLSWYYSSVFDFFLPPSFISLFNLYLRKRCVMFSALWQTDRHVSLSVNNWGEFRVLSCLILEPR